MYFLAERALSALASSALLLLFLIAAGLLLGQLKTTVLNVLCAVFGVRVGEFIINRLTFPGTIHHELSHALLAVISGAKVTRIRLFNLHGSTLGSVQIVPRGGKLLQSLQLCLSAIAPAPCGAITLYLLHAIIYPLTAGALWLQILVLYLMFCILLQMTLSRQDLKTALRGLPLTFLLLFAVMFVLGIDVIPVHLLPF